jgi:hypothetical protein
VRLPELLDLHAREKRDDNTKQAFEHLALLLGGAARASEVNDVAASVTAGHVNSSIACAKRILVGDLNMRLLCTLYQANPFAILNHAHTHTDTDYSNNRLSATGLPRGHEQRAALLRDDAVERRLRYKRARAWTQTQPVTPTPTACRRRLRHRHFGRHRRARLEPDERQPVRF